MQTAQAPACTTVSTTATILIINSLSLCQNKSQSIGIDFTGDEYTDGFLEGDPFKTELNKVEPSTQVPVLKKRQFTDCYHEANLTNIATMTNSYVNGPPSYYDQAGPVSYSYDNHVGPSSYPIQYGVNGHVYQHFHPQHPHHHYLHAQNPMIDEKPPQNYPQSPQPHSSYTYHHPYSAPNFNPDLAWHHPLQQRPEIHSPLPKQLLTSHSYAPSVEASAHQNEISLHPQLQSPPPPTAATPSSPLQTEGSPTSLPSSSSTPSNSQASPMSNLSPTWAIWSRRPTNPHLAPGLVFSSRIRPPDHIVRGALELRTPPASPVSEHSLLPETTAEPLEVIDGIETPVSTLLPKSFPSSASTEETSTTGTPSTTLPGSPASSTTSISVSVPAGASTDVSLGSPEDPVSTKYTASSLSEDATVVPTPLKSPPPLQKSWVSLFQPSSASSSSPAATTTQLSRPRLPMSSVVGFSVPGDASNSSSQETGSAIPTGKRAELIALLKSDFEPPVIGPTSSGVSYAAMSVASTKNDIKAKVNRSQIRPRGLINTGNMCFANSVLQLLMYSPPFFRLFHELGRVGMDEVKQVSGIRLPLVDATIDFLKEFLPEDRKAKPEEEMIKANARKASTSFINDAFASGSNSKSGKGKERSMTPQPEDDFCPFIPTGIYDALKTKKQFDSMRGGQQEDAEEFLGFYLEGLEEELAALIENLNRGGRSSTAQGKAKKKGANVKEEIAIEETEEDALPEAEQDGWMEVGKRNRTVVTRTIKSTDSPITRIFGGKFRSSLRVPGQKESAIVEDWRSLRLDIQRDTIHTIQEALSNISQPQTVHLSDPPREGSQLVLIEALPSVLVLHLKRFEYDASVGGVVKIGKQVSFGSELIIGPDVLSVKARNHLGAKGARYKLFGVIYHHGISASGGHYTLDVLHPDRLPLGATAKPREGWIRIDDELVSDVKPEDVFGQGDIDDGGVRCAYLLFYRRMK